MKSSEHVAKFDDSIIGPWRWLQAAPRNEREHLVAVVVEPRPDALRGSVELSVREVIQEVQHRFAPVSSLAANNVALASDVGAPAAGEAGRRGIRWRFGQVLVDHAFVAGPVGLAEFGLQDLPAGVAGECFDFVD